MKIRHDEEMVVNGRLTQVGVSFQVKTKNGRTRHAVFKCQCGSIVIGCYWTCCNVSQSCGCLTVEALKAGKHNVNRIPKHGMTETKVYHAWSNIVQRCTNSKNKHFQNYGGRGITVCDEWRLSFKAFYDHVGDPPTKMHTIDRIKNDRGYEPGNVRCVTRKENQRNRRNTYYVDYQGEKVPLSRVCEIRGVPTELVRNRLVWGWDLESAITKPLKVNGD